ncbi:hypothetical protein M9H77_04745 [Catharanthus roseus]|uniref:Uncharacterized protein n=1 Tax=Catharanthus roseus TaxID=4058 RepID=A0ACC0CFA3_CATRO|nr:hypothetical protein M9H77_04745 [Catharanthus roseus]
MTTCENWQLFVNNRRHNRAIGIYNHGHAQAAKLTKEQLVHTEQSRKSHVPPRNILLFFREQNVGCAVRYKMPLLEAVGMTSTYKNFTVATAFMRNEQGNEQDSSAHEPCVIIIDREIGLMLVIEEVFSTTYHMLCPKLERFVVLRKEY